MKVIFEYDELVGLMHVVLDVNSYHQLREVLIGFWLSLPEIEREILIMELESYKSSTLFRPRLSTKIAMALTEKPLT